MTSKSEDKGKAAGRKLARGFAVRDGADPIDSAETLRDTTIAACEAAFERRWGAPFLGGATLGAVRVSVAALTGDPLADFRAKARAGLRCAVDHRSGLARPFTEMWHADGGNAALELACRVRYEPIRAGDDAALAEARKVLEGEPDGAGGMAATYLKVFVLPGLVPPTAMPSFDELEASHPETADRDRKQARAAFVARFSRPVPWLGGATMTNREIAEAGILCEVWPASVSDWKRLLGSLEPPTVARVIEEAETGVRRLRASGTG